MVFVAFGITGDLMRLKIFPALLGLHRSGTTPLRSYSPGAAPQQAGS